MIALLTGTVVEREEKALLLEVGGVGYRVAVLPSVQKKAALGEVLTLRIHHHFLTDGQALYGFTSVEDLKYFELLLLVPTVGPRTAMNILEIAPPATLAQAVSEGDTALLTKVSGIGHKTADRIIVELKGKIAHRPVSGLSGTIQHDAISALTSIGYTAAQAKLLVMKLPPSIVSVEEAVRAVLQANVK